MVREMAQSEGISASTLQAIYSARDDLDNYKNTTNEKWESIIQYTHDPDPKVRMEAFDALSSTYRSPFASQALREAQRMKSDAAPTVRAHFPFVLQMLRSEKWKSEAEAALKDSDPQVREDAQRTLEGSSDVKDLPGG